MEGKIVWLVKKFDELGVHELYAVLKLRSEVFVVEQNCVFLDADSIDIYCIHVLGFEDSMLVAYSRIVPANLNFKSPSIGRVVVSQSGRAKGYGKLLVKKGIEVITNLYGEGAIEISAQKHLDRFYSTFGFEVEGEPYLEDGIPHIHMIRA